MALHRVNCSFARGGGKAPFAVKEGWAGILTPNRVSFPLAWPNRLNKDKNGMSRIKLENEIMTDENFLDVVDKAIRKYTGQSNELELAIGALMLARYVGWKPLMLMHDRKTIRRFEDRLKIKIREAVPAEGDLANKSKAWKYFFKKHTNFWKAVSGEFLNVKTNEMDK
ncbi:MAG: hypothetical protein WC464_02270 [Bdellovibrionales bacterium]